MEWVQILSDGSRNGDGAGGGEGRSDDGDRGGNILEGESLVEVIFSSGPHSLALPFCVSGVGFVVGYRVGDNLVVEYARGGVFDEDGDGGDCEEEESLLDILLEACLQSTCSSGCGF
ncbi:hypothetical protein SUGI_0380650 [Cryptomeria japonica]|nr:hypothetical protein SUGI_0380650 [Cryptomeria japonica]